MPAISVGGTERTTYLYMATIKGLAERLAVREFNPERHVQ